MRYLDFRDLPRSAPSRSAIVAGAIAVLVIAIFAMRVVAFPDGAGVAVPVLAYLALGAVVVAVIAVVLLDRESAAAERLAAALAEGGDATVIVLETTEMHAVLGTRRSAEEMVRSLAVVRAHEHGLQVWGVRQARAVELAEITWDRVDAVGAGEVRLGHRRTRAVMLELDGGRRSLPLVVASRARRWFAPGDDAHFAGALSALRRRGV